MARGCQRKRQGDNLAYFSGVRLVVCSKHRSMCVWLLHACCMHSLFIVLFPGVQAGNSALDEGHAGKHRL